MWVRLREALQLSGDSLVSIGNSNPCHRSCVASQEQERHVASRGHQVHQHGHPDGSQSRQAELLHQEATQEYAQTRTWDCRHPCKRKNRLAGRVSEAPRTTPLQLFTFQQRNLCASMGKPSNDQLLEQHQAEVAQKVRNGCKQVCYLAQRNRDLPPVLIRIGGRCQKLLRLTHSTLNSGISNASCNSSQTNKAKNFLRCLEALDEPCLLYFTAVWSSEIRQ